MRKLFISLLILCIISPCWCSDYEDDQNEIVSMCAIGAAALGALVVEEAEHYYHEYTKDEPKPRHSRELTPDDVRDEMHKQLEAGAKQRMQPKPAVSHYADYADDEDSESLEELEEEEDDIDAPVVMPACELQYLEARIGDYIGEDAELHFDEPDEEDIEEMQAPVYRTVYGIDPGIRRGDNIRIELLSTAEGRKFVRGRDGGDADF